MGRKARWFDAVRRIFLTPSSQPDHVEKEGKAGRSTEKSNFRKLWHFGKSNSSSNFSSASAAPPAPAPAPAPASREEEAAPQRDQQQVEEFRDAESAETTSEQNDHGYPPAEAVASSLAAKVAAVATLPAAAVTTADVAATQSAPARSEEELAAIKIQTACRGYLARRRAYQRRGHARLTSMLEGIGVKRQTEEALSCMQAMTRVQTQIYSRRAKTEEDKRALKTQFFQVKQQAPDNTKIGEGWDHSQQSKEQLEGTMAMKQEAASRRQRALSYAFSKQWRNRNRSSGRAKTAPTHPPMFMDPGCPNWGWSSTERWMAAARPWESQTTSSISVQIPTTPGRSVRPSPSTPTQPRSPSVSARTPPVPAPSPRSSRKTASDLHADTTSPRSSRKTASDLRADTTSPRSDQRPAWSTSSSSPRLRSNQELPGSSSSSPRTRSSQERSGSSSSPRPRSSQEHPESSSPLHGGKKPSLRPTASLRPGEQPQPRRLSLGGTVSPRNTDASDSLAPPVTPTYMQSTKSLRARTRCTSPSAAENVELPEGSTPRVPTPSAKKHLSLEFADRTSVSSPSTARARQHSQPTSSRI